ncbi:MAG: acyl-CoA dehydrogenase, partial [Rhodobacteraceae bacterium]|nr:acyl-CoA dehydrogenase [Paracoccaceae bacterium]
MSVSLVDLKQGIGNGMNIRQIKLMIGHQTYEVFFEDFETPGKTV